VEEDFRLEPVPSKTLQMEGGKAGGGEILNAFKSCLQCLPKGEDRGERKKKVKRDIKTEGDEKKVSSFILTWKREIEGTQRGRGTLPKKDHK